MTINGTTQTSSFSARMSSSDVPLHTKKKADLWVDLYERISDSAIATNVIADLEYDPTIQHAHAALHIRSRGSHDEA